MIPEQTTSFERAYSMVILLTTAFFACVLDLTLGRASLMPIQPTYLALLITALMAAVALVVSLRAGPNSAKMLGHVLRRSAGPALCYALLSAIAIALGIVPSAYWRESGKWIFLIPLGFVLWGSMLIALARPRAIDYAKRGLELGFILLAGSILWELAFPATFSNLESRASGFPGNSNFGALACSMLCAAVLTYGAQGLQLRNYLILVVAFLAVLATQSRSGLVELSIVLLLWGLSVVRDRSFSLRRALHLLAGWAIILSLVIGIASYLLQNSSLFSSSSSRYARMLSGKNVDDGSSDERIRLAKEALDLISAAPVIGHGTGFVRTMVLPPHNIYLQQWVNNGLIGVLSYLGLLVSSLVLFVRRHHIAGSVFISITAVGGMFSHNILDQRTFIFTLAILLAESALKRDTKSMEVSTRALR